MLLPLISKLRKKQFKKRSAVAAEISILVPATQNMIDARPQTLLIFREHENICALECSCITNHGGQLQCKSKGGRGKEAQNPG